MRMFGRPQGLLGRLGGHIMGRTHRPFAAEVIALLDIQPHDSVLEVGFGPGVGIQRLARSASAGCVAGIDASRAMVAQATARHVRAITRGRVDLRHVAVERLPFEGHTFETALAINSMHVWPDAVAGLRAMRRVIKAGGTVALGFTPDAGQPRGGLTAVLTAAGSTEAHVAETAHGFCALALKP
jgi:ubiquinone/menaquinone biosynthesis C-methylase UbiE